MEATICDPTVLAIGSTVAGLAGTAANTMGQMSAAKRQEDAYNQWVAQQEKNRQAAAAKDEQDRQMADAARAQGLQDVSATNQTTEQQAEQARLTGYLQGNQPASTTTNPNPLVPTSVADAALSGQKQDADSTFQSDLSAKLNKASSDAKQRIAALATVGSYGGSSGGLDVSNALNFAKAGQGIDLANEFRKGNLSVYGIQQAANPLQYQYNPSPLSPLSSTALSFGSQGLGQSLAKAMKVN